MGVCQGLSGERLLGLLATGDPTLRCGSRGTRRKWSVRSTTTPVELAAAWVAEISRDFTDAMPFKVRCLVRTIRMWAAQIVAWHQSHVSDAAHRSDAMHVRLAHPPDFGDQFSVTHRACGQAGASCARRTFGVRSAAPRRSARHPISARRSPCRGQRRLEALSVSDRAWCRPTLVSRRFRQRWRGWQGDHRTSQPVAQHSLRERLSKRN